MMFSWPGVRKTKEFGLGFVCMCVCLNLLFISVCGNVKEFTWTEKKKKTPGSLLEISIVKHHECCFC